MKEITFIQITTTPNKPFLFEDAGTYVVFFQNVSGKFEFQLADRGVRLYIFGLFTGSDADQYRIETIQHHLVGGAYSDLYIKGVFDDSSKFFYQGLIRIDPGAQQSHAYQKNQNLLLSSQAFVESNPFLEILANDVFCTHGSTTGRLNREQISYVQTRGIDEQSARQLLITGFQNEIIDAVNELVPDSVTRIAMPNL